MNDPNAVPPEPTEEFVFVVDGGAIEYLHTDKVPLHRLGRSQAERASDVEFDEDKQVWVAIERETGRVIAADECRETCIAEERRYFNQKLQEGLAPFRRENA